MHESVEALRIERKKPLVEYHVNRLLLRTFYHEFGARFAKDSGSIVNKLAGLASIRRLILPLVSATEERSTTATAVSSNPWKNICRSSSCRSYA